MTFAQYSMCVYVIFWYLLVCRVYTIHTNKAESLKYTGGGSHIFLCIWPSWKNTLIRLLLECEKFDKLPLENTYATHSYHDRFIKRQTNDQISSQFIHCMLWNFFHNLLLCGDRLCFILIRYMYMYVCITHTTCGFVFF